VSCIPAFYYKKSFRYENEKLEIIPPNAPTIRLAPGLVNKPQDAPIMTPPAKVAFSI